MKALKTNLILTAIALMLTSCYASRSTYAQGGYYDDYNDGYANYNEYDNYNNGGVSFNLFYNELSPYGRWINHRAHGRVWIPDVGGNFHPYATNGYWVMTDYGNTWVSDYSWGWAPFHYGRWYYDDYYGWAWVPGYEWAPAWVSWRSGGGYYGWAPMGPGININININLPARYWTFLPNRYMYYRNMHRHYNRYSPAIYNRTTIINNTYVYNDNRYYSGPTASDFRRETGRTATVRRLESSANRSGRASARVSNNAVQVYRPDATNGRTTTNRGAVNQRSSTTTRQATPNATTRSTTTNRNNTVGTESAPRSNSSVATPQRSTTTNRNTTVRTQSTTRSNSNVATPQRNNSSVATPQRNTTSNRNTTVRTQPSTRNSRVSTPQRSTSTNNRNSTVRSQSSTRGSSAVRTQRTTSSNRNSSATRSSSTSSTRESRSSGRR